jgi:hypothetical protein
MNRNRAASAVTILILAGLLGVAVLRRNAARQPSSPQDTIYRMLDAARSGNAAAYLGEYTGQMEAHLKQVLAEKGDAAFQRYLISANAEIKGVAVSPPKETAAGEVEIQVEYVYQERNEVQRIGLEQRGGRWKIARVDSAERVQTLVPYGSAVE